MLGSGKRMAANGKTSSASQGHFVFFQAKFENTLEMA